MKDRPRVFVSSTIRDFADLRAALKYWLEETGFQVLLSEYNDFPVNPRSSSFQNCLDAIYGCDYVIVLVGFRRGSWYDRSRNITVTRAEYQCAYERAKEKRLKLITCVRKEVEDALKAGNKGLFTEESSYEFAIEFIDEIAKKKEVSDAQLAGAGFPVGNWVHSFRDFRDLVQAVTASFRIGERLSRLALQANLLWELKSNLKRLLEKSNDKLRMGYIWCLALQKEIEVSFKDSEQEVYLTKDQMNKLAWDGMHVAMQNPEWLSTTALEAAINSGEFLEYDRSTGSFRVGELQAAMTRLLHEIHRWRNAFVNSSKGLLESVLKISDAHKTGFPRIIGMDVAHVFAAANMEHNVVSLSAGIAAYLGGLSGQLRCWELAPQSPFQGSAKRLQDEEPSWAELDEWLKSNFEGDRR